MYEIKYFFWSPFLFGLGVMLYVLDGRGQTAHRINRDGWEIACGELTWMCGHSGRTVLEVIHLGCFYFMYIINVNM